MQVNSKVDPTFKFLSENLASVVMFDTENHHLPVVFDKSIFENDTTFSGFRNSINSFLTSSISVNTFNIILAIEETKMHSHAINGSFQFNIDQYDFERRIILNTSVDLNTLTTDHFRNFLVEVDELLGE